MKQQHPTFRKLSWHPLVVAIPLAILVYSFYRHGFSFIWMIAWVIICIWFLMSVYNLATKHQLLDWMYSDDEEDELSP